MSHCWRYMLWGVSVPALAKHWGSSTLCALVSFEERGGVGRGVFLLPSAGAFRSAGAPMGGQFGINTSVSVSEGRVGNNLP